MIGPPVLFVIKPFCPLKNKKGSIGVERPALEPAARRLPHAAQSMGAWNKKSVHIKCRRLFASSVPALNPASLNLQE